jgi:hypothetical protein
MRPRVSTDPAIYAPGPVPQELDKHFLRWVHAELHRVAANLRQLGEAGGGLPNIYLDDDGNLILQPDLAEAYEFRIEAAGEVVTNLSPTSNSSNALTVTTRIDDNTPGSETGFHNTVSSGLTVLGSDNYNNLTSINGSAVFQGTGEVESLNGLRFLGRVFGAAGSLVKNLSGADVEINVFTGANAEIAAALKTKFVATGATIGDLYGIDVDLELLNTAPTNSYGLRVRQPAALDPQGGGVGRALDIQSSFYSSFRKGIGIGNTFATADPQATIHIANTDARHIRLGYSTNFNFDITNKGFIGTEIYSQNPFGSFFDASVVVLNCGFQKTGGRLLEIQNGGVAVAYIDAQGNYVKI